jgi:hypothetical protein
MSADPALEYGYARLSARLAGRPDERLWRQLRSARSLQAAIDAVRGTPAAPYVAGVAMRGTIDEIELAFRQHLRARIREVTQWAPQAWRAALCWTETLIDLPALQHLLADAPLPKWLHSDPHLAGYATGDRLTRRARLSQGTLAALVAGLATHPAPRTSSAARRGGERLHSLLRAWQTQWQQRWPRCSDEERTALLRLMRTLQAHLIAFGALPVEAAAPARERLAERLRRQLHDAAAQPASLFAYLLLVALDLERLRGEFVILAAGAAMTPTEPA